MKEEKVGGGGGQNTVFKNILSGSINICEMFPSHFSKV